MNNLLEEKSWKLRNENGEKNCEKIVKWKELWRKNEKFEKQHLQKSWKLQV